MDHADHFAESVDVAVAAVRGVDPARYGDPSPCSEFTLGKVIDHVGFGLLLAEISGLRKDFDPSWDPGGQAPFLIGKPESEWAELIAEQGRRAAAAWADPAVWNGDTTFAGGPMPAAAVGSMMTAELVCHGWDVAAASGQQISVSPELAQEALTGVEALAGMGREGGWYGAEVSLPPDAPTLDKALATSGRDPRWTP
jgi:uncharacterized protein (TIGR03086 family)